LRRQGHPDQRTPAAATRRENVSTPRPTREEAFDAFCMVLAYAAGHGSDERVFTQYDLPPGAKSSDSFKRRHRQLRVAGVAGVRVVGKVLECTASAWSADLPKASRTPKLAIVPPLPVDHDAEVATALGIVARKVSK
jgi:hypothetical protein